MCDWRSSGFGRGLSVLLSNERSVLIALRNVHHQQLADVRVQRNVHNARKLSGRHLHSVRLLDEWLHGRRAVLHMHKKLLAHHNQLLRCARNSGSQSDLVTFVW